MLEEKTTAKRENIDFKAEEDLPRNVNGEADGSESSTKSLTNLKSLNRKLVKLNAIRKTIDNLEQSLRLSRALETEQLSRYSMLKIRNWSLSDELREADKRNKTMLNLFRSTVPDLGLESAAELPWSLRVEIQRSWHRKYDSMLELSEKLKSEMSVKEAKLREKDEQIEALEQRLLNVADSLVQREEALTNVCTKYLKLKKRKDEQEFLLRGSIETLQDALQKATSNVNPMKSCMALMPSKEALLARESRRSDRLARENMLLRGLLQERRNSCTCSIHGQESRSSTSLN
ncbi:myosin-7-like [Venturia canescens]|uniref:myosin-7-like n=1 Tax=Venturia canescens TaxID=32260 RepID=UPI001C9CA39C|nr:myosin-7-like [Venturia canescens]